MENSRKEHRIGKENHPCLVLVAQNRRKGLLQDRQWEKSDINKEFYCNTSSIYQQRLEWESNAVLRGFKLYQMDYTEQIKVGKSKCIY